VFLAPRSKAKKKGAPISALEMMSPKRHCLSQHNYIKDIILFCQEEKNGQDEIFFNNLRDLLLSCTEF
ncbi:MAG: hypothetical protein ABIJ95_09640, partial [Pseudomonadota bacterium]